MIVSWKELLLGHLLLSLPEKVHCPEIPAVQPSWVCSQMDSAYIKSWLLLDWAIGRSSPYLFLNMCSGTYLNSPCLQVNHINTGLSWRLPEQSWTCDTQRESLPRDWQVWCLRNRAAQRSPSISPQRKYGRHASTLELLPQDVWDGQSGKISSAIGSREGDSWPLLLCAILCPMPMEHLGLCVVFFSGESFCLLFQCGDRASPSLLIISLLLTMSSCLYLSLASLSLLSLITISKEVTRKLYQKMVLCFAFDFLFAGSFRELKETPLQCLTS